MDWEAVSSAFAERDVDVLVVDDTGVLLLISRSVAGSLGWQRHEIEGRDWIETLVAHDERSTARWHQEQALRGAVQNVELTFITRERAQIAVTFELQRVGLVNAGLLLFVKSTRRIEAPVETQQEREELVYEIDGARKLLRIGTEPHSIEMTCYAALHSRSEPCEQCPLNIANAPWPRVTAEMVSEKEYLVRTATQDRSRTRIEVRRVTQQEILAIHDRRIARLAERAKLSPREATILSHLLNGSSALQIASAVGISERTVKFHQSNLLQKLGADSRFDLLRLLF